jgi:hypothetical protein
MAAQPAATLIDVIAAPVERDDRARVELAAPWDLLFTDDEVARILAGQDLPAVDPVPIIPGR